MQDGSEGVAQHSRDGSKRFQPFGQFTNRQREGYLVEAAVQSSSHSRPGRGSSESRPGRKSRKTSDRRREETLPAIPAERPDPKQEALSEDSYTEIPEESYEDSSGNGYAEIAGASSWGGPGSRSDSHSHGHSESSSDSSSSSSSDTSSGDCPWCCGDCSEKPRPQPVCPEHELLHSIALEELAIAHLINAEAEKAQKVAQQKLAPLTPDELIGFQHSIARVLEMAVEKEKLLLKKLRLLLFKSSHCDDSDF